VPARGWSWATWGLFLVIAVIWGFNYIFVNLGLEFASPLWLATLRAGVGVLASAAILAAFGGEGKLDRRGQRDAMLIGIPSITVFFALWFEAASSVLPGFASVVINTLPLWIALLSAPILSHHLTGRHWVSVVIGFVGVVLISQIGTLTGSSVSVVVVLELLFAAFSWALATVLFQRRFRQEEMLEANLFQLTGGFVGLVALTLVLAPTPLPTLGLGLLTTVGYLGLLGTAVGYSVWLNLLGRTRAATLGAYLFVVPVVALVASAMIFDERLSYLQLVGVVLVLVSIYGIGKAPGASDPLTTPSPDRNGTPP
jgi:probable blue pigment (indigoidine) exporter